MRPLGIAVVCHGTLGGSGIVAAEIGLRLGRRGHRVWFVGAEPPRRWVDGAPGVRFHAASADDGPGPPGVGSLALAGALVEVVRAHDIDVIHAHYAVPHAFAALLARDVVGDRVSVLTTLHGTDVTRLGADPRYRPLLAHAVRASDRVTAPSAFLRDAARDGLGLDVRIEVVPNFVEPSAEPAEAPEPTVVHVSNFRPVKRVGAVVDVFARLLARRPARLRLVGDGPDRAAVEAEVARRGLGDRVQFVGEVAQVEPWVRGCAAFLLPSASESFGVAALEALAVGVPVVASAVGGLPEVVRDGVTGFLRPPDDAEGMADGLAALLGDPALWARMSRAARDDVAERFRPEPILARYEAVYAELVTARASRRPGSTPPRPPASG